MEESFDYRDEDKLSKEEELDRVLRPKEFGDFAGQQKVSGVSWRQTLEIGKAIAAAGIRVARRKLQAYQFDTSIDCQSVTKSALACWLYWIIWQACLTIE